MPRLEEEEDRQDSWKRHDVKERKILMDFVKSQFISHISTVAASKDLFDTLNSLIERDSTSRSIALRTQLHTIKMKRSESVDSYFTRVVEIKDQLGNEDEQIPEKEISIYILHGLPNTWESFVQSVTSHDNLPKYDRLWADCVKE